MKVCLPQKWKQNSKITFNYNARLKSVSDYYGTLFFLAMLVFLYDVISCDIINVENFHEILRYFFWILAKPLNIYM